MNKTYNIKGFGEIKVLKKIGSGNFGNVFKIEHDGKILAMKYNLKIQIFENRILEFLKEYSHKNILKIHHVHDNVIITDYYPQELKDSNIDPMDLAKGLLEGLSFLKTLGIHHHDIKQDNIMIDDEGNPVIVDFGFALFHTDKDTRYAGSPLYQSPERLMKRSFDHTSDIYSLGLLIWERLTGKIAYNVKSYKNLINRIVFDGERPSLDGIDGEVARFLEKTWLIRGKRYDADALLVEFSDLF